MVALMFISPTTDPPPLHPYHHTHIHISVLISSLFYQTRPGTQGTGTASHPIHMLFLVSPDKLDIELH